MRRSRATISEELPASARAAFDLVHDYERRLSWDTLLRDAYVEDGRAPSVGAIAVCTGRWFVGGLRFATAYVSFRPGEVAAVRMTNRPWPFDEWAASIRHIPLGETRSRIVYTLSFTARPRALAWLIEPILNLAFRVETRRRLRALRVALSR
ncbi:MAG: SRPBCC family protein [Sandaracinaceae bacterium]